MSPDLVQVEVRQQPFTTLGLLNLGNGLQLAQGHEVLPDREAAEDAGFLGQVADAQPRTAVHGQGRHVLAHPADAALVRGFYAHHHVEGRGLSCPVGPQEAHNLPSAHKEAHIPHHGTVAITFLEVHSFKAVSRFSPGSNRTYEGVL